MRAVGLDDGDIARVRQVLDSFYVPWQESTFPGLLGNVVAGRIANRFDLGGPTRSSTRRARARSRQSMSP